MQGFSCVFILFYAVFIKSVIPILQFLLLLLKAIFR